MTAIRTTRVVRCVCGEAAQLVGGDVIYPQRIGLHQKLFWNCECGRYVGCHKGTTRPLGQLADKETRSARQAAHRYFDPLWRSGRMKRRSAYKWLSEQMGMKVVHIGNLDAVACRDVVRICRKWLGAGVDVDES